MTSDDLSGVVTAIDVILVIVLCTFNVWIVLANILLTIGLWHKGTESELGRVPTDCYLINLAIVEICGGIFVLPIMIVVAVASKFPFTPGFCIVWAYLDYYLMVVSSYGYAALFLNHFTMIRAPGKYRNSLSTHCLLIGLLWILANLSWGPGFLKNVFEIEKDILVCGYDLDNNVYYTLYVGLSGFYIPFLISIICPLLGALQLRKLSHPNRLFYNIRSQFKPGNGTMACTRRNWSLAIILQANHILLTRNQARKEQRLMLGLLGLLFLSRISFYVYFGVGAFDDNLFPPNSADGLYWILNSAGALGPILHLALDLELRESIRHLWSSCRTQCHHQQRDDEFNRKGISNYANQISLDISNSFEEP